MECLLAVRMSGEVVVGFSAAVGLERDEVVAGFAGVDVEVQIVGAAFDADGHSVDVEHDVAGAVVWGVGRVDAQVERAYHVRERAIDATEDGEGTGKPTTVEVDHAVAAAVEV